MNPKLQKGANTNKTRKAGRTHLRCLSDDCELQSQRSGVRPEIQQRIDGYIY